LGECAYTLSDVIGLLSPYDDARMPSITGFDPWVGKIPWRKERLPTPVFWRGEFHELYNPRGCKELDTAEGLSLHL